MSLTSYIKQELVREKIDELYDKPDFDSDSGIKAPPITEKPSLVGTAFDYLMRFWLEYRNPQAQTRKWVAKEALSTLSCPPAPPNRGGTATYI